jgi:type II secretory pathway component GspD/PulD (secretin)
MRLSPLAFAFALAGCAATPQVERAYELRTTVYEMPAELAQSLTGSDTSGALPAPANLVERARAAASSRTDVQASSRPMIRVREGSTAELSNTSGTDYIQDYTVGADGKTQVVHATAEQGLALELKPTQRETGLELAYRAELSQLVQWTEETERTLSNGEKVKLKFPIVAKRGLQSKTSLAEGECLALLLSPTFSGRTTLVCVSAVPVGGGR